MLYSNKKRFFARFESSFSDEFKSLISAMLHPDPRMRPSYQDIMMHPWVLNDFASKDEAIEDLQDRHAARSSIQQNIPASQDGKSRAVPKVVRRDTTVSNTTYVVRELTADEQAANTHKKMNINSFRAEHKVPGSRIIAADMSAPDLFS